MIIIILSETIPHKLSNDSYHDDFFPHLSHNAECSYRFRIINIWFREICTTEWIIELKNYYPQRIIFIWS